MKLHELKPGMIVEFRNGDRGLVVNDLVLMQCGCAYTPLGGMLDNLKSNFTSSCDIVRVYKSEASSLDRIFDDDTLLKIWDRFDIVKGDKVRVMRPGQSYTTNLHWFATRQPEYKYSIRYAYGQIPRKGDLGRVIMRDGDKILFERAGNDGYSSVYLMDIKGLEKVED